ncbi:extracellular solute-binding protein, family 7 [Vibrio alginolyticus 12G01]|nr:extracellular solute-binding protein, family 7 [Vibrio alginolyticus 12G01]
MSLIQKSLKRVLKTTAVAAAMALAATSVNAAEKVYRLKLAETWGPNFPILVIPQNMAKWRKRCPTDVCNPH